MPGNPENGLLETRDRFLRLLMIDLNRISREVVKKRGHHGPAFLYCEGCGSCRYFFFQALLASQAFFNVSPRRPSRRASRARMSSGGTLPRLTLQPKRRIRCCC